MKIYDFNGKKNICAQRVKEARNKLSLSQENPTAKLQLEGVVIERDSVSRKRLALALSLITKLLRCAKY